MKVYDEEIEDFQQQKLDWELLKKLLPRFRKHLKSLVVAMVLLATFSLLSLAGPLLVRHAIDVNIANGDLPGLLTTASIYFVVLVLAFVFNYFQMVKLEIVGQKIVKGIRMDIFTHLTRLPQSFFDINPVGKLLSRVENDTEALRTMFTYTVVTILSDLMLMIGMFVIMFTISPRLALVLLSVAPVIILTVKYFNRRIVPIFIEVRRRMADIYAFIEEYLRGVKIVQVFDQENTVINNMDKVNKAKVDVEYKGEKLSVYFGNLVFFLATMSTALILGVGGKWVLERPDMLSIGTLVAFLGYIQRVFGPIFHLSEQMNVVQRAFSGAKRMFEILDTPMQSHEPVKVVHGTRENAVVGRTSVEFKNVWFAYKDNDWVLKNISFELLPGKKVALIGSTGGGKTSIINLLFRFYDFQKGQVLVDGMDIKTIPLPELRTKLGLVLQDIVLFPGTVLQNMRLEDTGISEKRVMEALRIVKAQDIVERIPGGLHGMLSEHGSNLSMGERQLLSFARALVFNPQILVLDEATSSVDPLTEQRVQEAVERLLKGRTALIIAHRLQTILECDEIMVVQHGRIEERGTHSELMDRKGIYWKLYQVQFGAEKVS